MTQPSFVPIGEADQVRPVRMLEAPGQWYADRPAELRTPVRPGGKGRGSPGPDQGFALRLARRFEPRLRLVRGESAEDALLGCALVASRRAALFGRAPSVHDLSVAFGLFGYLEEAPPVVVSLRRPLFRGISHDYAAQRRLVDSVSEETLRLPVGQVPPLRGAEVGSSGVDAGPDAGSGLDAGLA